MHWWPFGKRRRKQKRSQSAEPPRDTRDDAKAAAHARSYTAPASAAPHSPISPAGSPVEARLPPIPHHGEDFSLSPFDDPPTTAEHEPTAIATDSEKQVPGQDSYEELTALPKSKGIEHSPHLRPLPESEINNRSKRSAGDAALLRRKSSKKRKENEERAAQLKAMTEPIQIPKKKKSTASVTGAGLSFLSRSGSKKSHRASKKVMEHPQHGSMHSLPEVPSGRSSMTGPPGDRNRFEFGSIGVLSPRPQLRYSLGPPANIHRSNVSSRAGPAVEKTSPSVSRHVLKGSKTIDEFADDLDAHTLRELMDRDQRRRDRRASRDGESARKKLDKLAGKEKAAQSKPRRKSSPKPVDTNVARAESSSLGAAPQPLAISETEKERVETEDPFRDEEAALPVDKGHDVSEKKLSQVEEKSMEDDEEGEELKEGAAAAAAAAAEAEAEAEASKSTTAATVSAGPFADPPDSELKSLPQPVEAKAEDSRGPGPVDEIERQTTATTTATTTSGRLQEKAVKEDDGFIAIPYEASASPSPPVSARDSRRISGLSQPTDGRSTPVEELNRSASRTSVRRSGTLSALFRRSGTGKKRPQDQTSDLSFSNTSRESMSRQAPPAHLVRDTNSPDLTPRRTSGTLRAKSRFREDLPEYDAALVVPDVPELPTTSAVAAASAASAATTATAMAETEDSKAEAVQDVQGEESGLPPPLPAKSMMRTKSSNSAGSPTGATQRESVILATLPAVPTGDVRSTSQEEMSESSSPILPQTLASVDSEGSWLTGRPNRKSSQRTSLEQGTPSSPVRERTTSDDGMEEDESTSAVATPRVRRPKSPVDRLSIGIEDYSDDGASTPQAQAGQTVRLEQIVRGSIARSPTVVYHQPRVKSNEGLLRQFDEDGKERDKDDGDQGGADENEIETTEYAASSHLGSTQYDTASEGYGTEMDEIETPDIVELPISYGIQHARTASAGSARILDIVNRPGASLDGGATDKTSMDTARAASPH